MLAVLLAELWHHAGFYVVIFMANLAICDVALEEAADIDGARPWQKTLYVILPQLRPAIVINLVYALIQFLKTFTVIVVTTKGGPNGATNFLSYHAWQYFDEGRYGEATAMAAILFAIVMVIALSVYLRWASGDAPHEHASWRTYPGIAISVLFVYPYAWMFGGAFRSTRAVLTAPLRLWPESFDLSGFASIWQMGDLSLIAGVASIRC